MQNRWVLRRWQYLNVLWYAIISKLPHFNWCKTRRKCFFFILLSNAYNCGTAPRRTDVPQQEFPLNSSSTKTEQDKCYLLWVWAVWDALKKLSSPWITFKNKGVGCILWCTMTVDPYCVRNVLNSSVSVVVDTTCVLFYLFHFDLYTNLNRLLEKKAKRF